MQYLTHLIEQVTLSEDWASVKIIRSRLSVSHLLFADDLILFSRADIQNAKTIINIFNSLHVQSG